MSLYANSKVVKKTIEMFCELKQCRNCQEYFCELTNVGMWNCLYHPGEYDTSIHAWTCCGESMARPHLHNPYISYDNMMTWGPKNKHQIHPMHSKGCKRRDCVPNTKDSLNREVIDIDGIACLVPYMDPPLKQRPGFKKAPLRLLRQEPFPKNVWHKPPLDYTGEEDDDD